LASLLLRPPPVSHVAPGRIDETLRWDGPGAPLELALRSVRAEIAVFELDDLLASAERLEC
jgi:hypothetical protein